MNITLNPALSFTQLGQRDNQQDCRFLDADVMPSGQRLYVVCDGVGGLSHGEVASQAVCNAMAHALNYRDWNSELTAEEFAQALDTAYTAVEREAKRLGTPMGTTMVCAAIHTGGISIAHIGDSRGYHIRPGVDILLRTSDHTMVNELVHLGNITAQDALESDNRNVISRCIRAVDKGRQRDRATVTTLTDIQAGDYVLICTDGVTACVDDDQLLELFSDDSLTAEQKMQRLANLCQDGYDNNTAILVQVAAVDGDSSMLDDLQSPPQPLRATRHDRRIPSTGVVEVAPIRRERHWWQRLMARLLVGGALATTVATASSCSSHFPSQQQQFLARHGDSEAAKAMARWCTDSHNPIRSEKQAAQWWTSAAHQGDGEASYQLGQCYEHGRGVTADSITALNHYGTALEQDTTGWVATQLRQQAIQGDCAVCATALARAYAHGQGVESSIEQAKTYFLIAAGQHFAPAIDELARIEHIQMLGHQMRQDYERKQLQTQYDNVP